MANKYKLGEKIKGFCSNCYGRGRKEKHLEYLGNDYGDEVICLVCSMIHKIEDIK